MHTTNYQDFFISVSPDSSAKTGILPKESTAAGQVLLAVQEEPYTHLSDDLIFGMYAEKRGISNNAEEKASYFSKGRACFRASALGKRYGWGLHYNEHGAIAAYAVDSPEYAALSAKVEAGELAGKPAMRSKRR
jgi:hypothetical protein